MNIIFFLLPIIVISLIIPVYAEKGLNYDDVIIASFPNGTQLNRYTSAPERIISDDVYVDYRFINGADFLSVETGHGSIKLNKNTCSFDFYKKGIITGVPLFTDSIVPKIANNGTNTWNELTSIINASCETYGNQDEIVAKKYVANVGFMEYKYINTGSAWQTQLEATNLSANTNKKFGFTQTINLNRDTVIFGDSQINLDNYSNSTFDRTWLENHDAKLLNFLNDISFDFDLGYDKLESVYILDMGNNKSKISFNYLRNQEIILTNETLIIDPTFGTPTSEDSNEASDLTPAACNGKTVSGVVGTVRPTADATICRIPYQSFNIASIPTTATVTSASYTYDVTATTFTGSCYLFDYTTNPGANQASYDAVFTAAGITTSNTDCQSATDNKVFNMNSTGITKIQQNISGGEGFYALGLWFVVEPAGQSVTIRSADSVLSITYTTTNPPYAVTDLTNPSETTTTKSLSWTAPYAGGGGQTIIGYQINQTTPWTNNPLVLVNDTGVATTTYVATGLTPGTDYSFRVSAWTNNTGGHPYNNATGNILNVTTPLNSYSTVAPTNLEVFPVICNATVINLQWSAGLMNNINGYRIQYETPVGGGFSSVILNTANTLTYYNHTGLTANNNYNYRVYSLNSTGISAASNQDASYTCHLPNAVTDLTGSATDLQTIILTWDATPVAYSTILGYIVNYTTPSGAPTTIFDANTGTTLKTDTVYGLSIGLNYSFRVSPVTIFGSNSSGNIFNATTSTAFTLGSLDLSDTTNTNDFKIFYNRTNTNTTSILLEVTYPSSYTLTCNMQHKFSRDNNTYTGLTETAISGPGADTDNVVSSFVFNGANTEIILVNCYDLSVPDSAKYVITVTDFALLEQIENFRNGTYGTSGQIGGLDLISLIVVIIGMIGFNRVTPIAGVIFTVITVFTLAWFEIITVYQIMYPALMLVILLAYVRTRQSD